MKTKNIIVTIVANPVPIEGLAHSISCQVVNARCLIDDPKYETWSIDYMENEADTVEVLGTPATLIATANQRAMLYWNNEAWRIIPTPLAKKILGIARRVIRRRGPSEESMCGT